MQKAEIEKAIEEYFDREGIKCYTWTRGEHVYSIWDLGFGVLTNEAGMKAYTKEQCEIAPSIINKPVSGIDASKIIEVLPRMLKENSRKIINKTKF